MKTWVVLAIAASLSAISVAAASTASTTRVPDDPAATPKAERPTTAVPRDGCVTSDCHTNIKSTPVLHGPVLANACDSCHRLVDPARHEYEDTRSSTEMCLFCHEFEIPESEMVHEPLATGECLPCHDPHGGSGTSLLRGGNYVDLCKSCHRDLTGARHIVHGPASAGACGACHEPHSSSHRKLLSVDGPELCLRCHVVTAVQLEQLDLVHAPVRDGCDVCHDPHAADNSGLVVQDPITLCTSCHENIGHTDEFAKTRHGALMTERSCLNCHDPHASDNPRLLRDNVRNLCFECHDDEILLENGDRIANMKAIIEGGTSVHGPAAENNCTACHRIHGGPYSRLLESQYPSTIYAAFEDSMYALCFSCHDSELVKQEKTDSVTSFRNGTTNLHYLHVHKDKKGRTCRVCHDSHAANRGNHIRESIAFGPNNYMIDIKWEPTENGGRCAAGCHVAYEYNRIEPMAYPGRNPEKKWRGDDLVPGTKGDDPKKDDGHGRSSSHGGTPLGLRVPTHQAAVSGEAGQP
ncbi:MAG: hypothetical protein KDC38_02600 [Planctomycetes bacterium]|nr:hypothetical protein [Planctomycetota bacterium]